MNMVLSAGAIGLLIFGILEYIAWKARKDNASQVANLLLDKQIEDRDKSIADAAKKAKEETDAYYAARAKFNAEYHPDLPPRKPPTGG